MPDYAIPHLEGYMFTEAERTRRLVLLERFRPGRVSTALSNALFWVEDDEDIGGAVAAEEVQHMELKKRRKEWPWLRWMTRWGYPPGWIAGRSKSRFLGTLLYAFWRGKGRY